MFHLGAYVGASGAGPVTNLDVPAVSDTILGIRNNHFILQYPMQIPWYYGLGNTISLMRFSSPTLTAYGFPQIWPLDTAAAVLPLAPDRPAKVDLWPNGIQLPLEEEIAVQVTTTGVPTERDALLAWFCTPDHNLNLQPGIVRVLLAAQYTVTPAVIYTWTNSGALTFQQNLRGGWWWVNGMFVFDAAALAARIVFPNPPSYYGTPLRPGCIVQTLVGNRPSIRAPNMLGTWGAFNTIVPPTLEILPSTLGARTGQIIFDLTYVGPNPPPGYH